MDDLQKINTIDFSSLSPENQKSIKHQMLQVEINNYGRESVTSDNGQKTTDASFVNFKKARIIDKFVALEEGCEMWVEDEKYPCRFCPNSEKIKTVHRFKKVIPILCRSLSGWKKIISIPYILLNKDNYIDFLWYGMQDVYYVNPKYYSQPVREIYRVFNQVGSRSVKVRDIVCAILEFDTAYRYRFQDVFSEVNLEVLNKNFFKEIERVSVIAFNRESSLTNGIGKFKKYLPLVMLYLWFDRTLMKNIVEFLLCLEKEEIQLSKEDIYWIGASMEESDYNYRGLTFNQRREEYLT